MFIIKGMDDTYINNARGIRIVHSLAEATKWETEKKASNVLVNCCMNTIALKHKLSVVEIRSETTRQQKKRITYTPINEMTEVSKDINLIKRSISDLQKRKQLLKEQLSKTDKEINDLLHVAEICNLNAYQGYKLYKEMQIAGRKRRQIKNERAEIDMFLSAIRENDIKTLENRISSLYKKEYESKKISELFSK